MIHNCPRFTSKADDRSQGLFSLLRAAFAELKEYIHAPAFIRKNDALSSALW